jgi:hypothetical protein
MDCVPVFVDEVLGGRAIGEGSPNVDHWMCESKAITDSLRRFYFSITRVSLIRKDIALGYEECLHRNS